MDGHLKFWKKKDPSATDAGNFASGVGVEFVKHYRAHLSPILALTVSANGALAATIAADGHLTGNPGDLGSVKVFDVENFGMCICLGILPSSLIVMLTSRAEWTDMINIFSLDYKPSTACWVHPRGQSRALLAIAEEDSHIIRLYDGRGESKPVAVIENVHRKGNVVTILAYNEPYDTVVSADDKGMIEYWSPREPFELPETAGMWRYKSDTDLYEFRKVCDVAVLAGSTAY